MTILNDGDVEIDGYVMGTGYDVFVTELDDGGVDLRIQDTLNPVGGNRLFGRDLLTPASWTLSLVTDCSTAADGLAALGQLAHIARNEAVRLDPGALSLLRYNVAGRTRRVYGRLRRPKRKPGPVNDGVIEAVAMFDAHDSLYYEDDERSVSVQMVPPPTGGITVPTTVPLVFAGLAEQQGNITDVGGTEPTPLRAVIHGPINGPGLAGDGWEVKLNDSIAEGVSVTIDARLGTVIDSEGVSRAGALTRFSRLQNARLHPGPDHVIFSGTDPTGQASADVYWRPAYSEF